MLALPVGLFLTKCLVPHSLVSAEDMVSHVDQLGLARQGSLLVTEGCTGEGVRSGQFWTLPYLPELIFKVHKLDTLGKATFLD